jgi:hypothetical protein
MHDTPPSYTRRCTTDCAYVTDGNKILKTQLVLWRGVYAWEEDRKNRTESRRE